MVADVADEAFIASLSILVYIMPLRRNACLMCGFDGFPLLAHPVLRPTPFTSRAAAIPRGARQLPVVHQSPVASVLSLLLAF